MPTLTREEIGQRGQEIYETRLRATLETEANIGKVVSIDVQSGDYEVADDLLAAGRRLQVRHPDALMYESGSATTRSTRSVVR